MPIAIIILAHGAPLSATRIVSLIEQAPPEMQAALDQAITNSSSYQDPYDAVGPGSIPTIDGVREAGRALGQARRLQCLQLPGATLALYCPVMGAEFEEIPLQRLWDLPVGHELRNASR